MRRIGCKAMLLLGSIMVLGGTAQAQYLRSSYFMEGTSTYSGAYPFTFRQLIRV